MVRIRLDVGTEVWQTWGCACVHTHTHTHTHTHKQVRMEWESLAEDLSLEDWKDEKVGAPYISCCDSCLSICTWSYIYIVYSRT